VGNNEDGEKKGKEKLKKLSRKQQISQLSFDLVDDDEATQGDKDKENSAPSEG